MNRRVAYSHQVGLRRTSTTAVQGVQAQFFQFSRFSENRDLLKEIGVHFRNQRTELL